jgi:DNA-damage-inducible protein J
MSITQTVEIPVNHKLTIDVPPEVPAGTVILTFTPTTDSADVLNSAGECPICAAYRDPITGNPRYNAETVAAIEEGIAISRGEIPAKRFHSLAEMIEDLERDDTDD